MKKLLLLALIALTNTVGLNAHYKSGSCQKKYPDATVKYNVYLLNLFNQCVHACNQAGNKCEETCNFKVKVQKNRRNRNKFC